MTLPTFISKSAMAGTIGSSLSVAYPTSLQQDDLLVLVIGSTSSSAANTITAPASPWVQKHALEPAVIKGQQAIYYRFVPSGGLTGSLAVTVTTPTANAALYGMMYAFRGGEIVTPFEGGALTNGTADPITMPAVTTAGADRLAVAFAFDTVNFAGALSNPTGETGGDWTTFSSNNLATGDVGSMFAFSAAMAALGTISGGSAATALTGTWANRAFAIRPATLQVSTSLDIRRRVYTHTTPPEVLDSDGTTATGPSRTTAVITPCPGRYLFVWAIVRDNAAVTNPIIAISHSFGGGLTFTQVPTGASGTNRFSLFRALVPEGAGSSSMTITITNGLTGARWGLIVHDSPSFGDFVQSKTSGNTTSASPSVVLDAVPLPGSYVFSGLSNGGATVKATPVDTLLLSVRGTAGVQNELAVQQRIGGTATCQFTGCSTNQNFIFGVEISQVQSISKALDVRRVVTVPISDTLDIRRVITVPISKTLDIRRAVTSPISKALDIRRAVTVPISKPIDIRRAVTVAISKTLDIRRRVIASPLTVSIAFPFVVAGGATNLTTANFAVLANDLLILDVTARRNSATDQSPNFLIINQTHTGIWSWTRIQLGNGVANEQVVARFMAIAPEASTGKLTINANITAGISPIRWKLTGAIWRNGLPIIPDNNVFEALSATPTAPSITLPNVVHSDAAVFGAAFTNAVGPAIGPGTNFTELQEAIDALASSLEQEYRIADPTQIVSWTATGTLAMSVASEIYGLVAPVSKALDIRRQIVGLSSVSKTLDIRRVVTSLIAKALDIRRPISVIISDTVDIRRSVTSLIAKALDIRRVVIGSINKSLDIRRSVTSPISKPLDIRRSIISIRTKTLDIRRSVTISATRALDIRRPVTVFVSDTVTLSRLIFGAVIKALSIRRNLNIIFSKQIDLRRVVIGRVGRSLELDRFVIGKVTKSLDIRRSLTTSVAKALDIRRPVTILASDTIDLRRSVTIFTSDSLDIRRSILTIVSDAVTLERAVSGAVARSVNLRRNINVIISKSLDIRRTETVIAARTLDLRRVVIGNIFRTLQIARDVIGRVADTIDIRRSVLAAVVGTLQLERRILSRTSRALDIRRSITAPVVKTLDIRRDVIARLTKILTVIRSVQFRVTGNLNIRRDILSAFTVFTGITVRRSIIARTTANLDIRRVITVPISKALTVVRIVTSITARSLDIRRSLTISVSRPLNIRRSVLIPVSQNIDFRRTIVIITSDSLNILRRVDARTGRPLDIRRQISVFTAANVNLRRKVIGLAGEPGIRIDHVIAAKWQIGPIRGTMQPTLIRGKVQPTVIRDEMGYPQ